MQGTVRGALCTAALGVAGVGGGAGAGTATMLLRLHNVALEHLVGLLDVFRVLFDCGSLHGRTNSCIIANQFAFLTQRSPRTD